MATRVLLALTFLSCAPTLIDTAPNVVCGNGRPEEKEECDDGNLASADGCSVGCNIESGWECEGSPSQCRRVCSNGFVEPGEQCDDGNSTNNDGCDNACQIEAGFKCAGAPSQCKLRCGDGRVDPSESCDDNNRTNLDGCSAACITELGWVCVGEPSVCGFTCGNGQLDFGEACDDGGTESSDGCSFSCAIEGGWQCSAAQPSVCATNCGDGLTVGAEECDRAELRTNAACIDCCRTNCTLQKCGDGIVDTPAGEECDDASTTSGGPCTLECQRDLRWVCPQGSTSTDDCACAPGYSGPDCATYRIFVSPSGTSNAQPTSWSNALGSIAQAALFINTSRVYPSDVCEVWVAAGSYNVNNQLVGVSGVVFEGSTRLYGSFAGTEAVLEQRTMGAEPTTILNGAGLEGPALSFLGDTDIDGIVVHNVPGNKTGAAAAILVLAAGDVSLKNTIVRDNVHQDATPGVRISASHVQVDNCQFINNEHTGSGTSAEAEWGCGLGISASVGITLSNSVFANNVGKGHGGGARLEAPVITVSDSEFEANDTRGWGGGLYLNASVKSTVENTSFTNNEAPKGAGIFVLGELQLTNVLMTGNDASVGGGVRQEGGAPLTIENSAFTSNIAGAAGGALAVIGNKLHISNTDFVGNTTGPSNNAYGGAIAWDSAQGAALDIVGSRFWRNVASSSLASGGAIRIGAPSSAGTVSIRSTEFIDNLTQAGAAETGIGGAIRCVPSAGATVAFTIKDTVFAANIANPLGKGGAVHAITGCTFDISESRFISNQTANQGAAIWLDAGSPSAAINFSRSDFADNVASGSNAGSAFYVHNVALKGTYSRFIGNVGNSTITAETGSTNLWHITFANKGQDYIKKNPITTVQVANSLVKETSLGSQIQVTGTTFCGGTCTEFVAPPSTAGLTLGTRSYDAATAQTIVNINGGATFAPGELVGMFVRLRSDNGYAPIVSNEATSFRLWGNVTGRVTNGLAMVLEDYHLKADSALIDAATISLALDPLDTDWDGDAPVCVLEPVQGFQCRDVGADEFVP